MRSGAAAPRTLSLASCLRIMIRPPKRASGWENSARSRHPLNGIDNVLWSQVSCKPLWQSQTLQPCASLQVLNFSIAYGKTAHGLSKDFRTTVKEAKETVDKWYADRHEVPSPLPGPPLPGQLYLF